MFLTHSHTNTHTETESPPGTVNNFKHPGKQTDKSTPLTWKHDNFPLRASQKNKILRERNRLYWQEQTSLTKSLLFIIWHGSVAGFRPIRHELPAATSKHSHVTIQPFWASKASQQKQHISPLAHNEMISKNKTRNVQSILFPPLHSSLSLRVFNGILNNANQIQTDQVRCIHWQGFVSILFSLKGN